MKSVISGADRAQGPANPEIEGEEVSLPGLIFAVLACGASAATWLWFTSPKLNYIWNVAVPLLVLLLCGLVVPVLVLLVGGVAGLLDLKVAGLTAPPMKHRRYMHSRQGKYHAFAVLLAAAMMTSIMFHVPLRARFALNRSAFDAFVSYLQATPDASLPATMRVGSFLIETKPRHRRDGALVFHLAGDSEAGFTYSATPIGYPGWNPGDGHSLGGGWYWFSDD